MTDADQEFNWQRRWLPLDGASVDTPGYGEALEDAATPGVTLKDLADVPCLILLGAPGSGKSRAARLEVIRLREAGLSVDYIKAGADRDIQGALLTALDTDHARTWLSGTGVWSLVVDGVDEAPGGALGFEQALRRLLDSLQKLRGSMGNLRLRLFCRTMDWSPSLDQTLSSYWTEPEVFKRQIAPLTLAEVRVALRHSISDERCVNAFIEEVTNLRIEALASRPVSLKLLIDLFNESGRLPNRQADLYQHGLNALVASTSRASRPWSGRGPSEVIETMSVAARIAAVTTFSGEGRIWAGLDASMQPVGTCHLSSLGGGYELSPPTSFPVSEIDVLAVLRTPLFEAVGTDTYAWSHQTFMEYLAAQYLLEHGLTTLQIHDFISVKEPHSDVIGIAPQLREVGAWIATKSPEYFRLLVDREPDVLLQSDVAAATPDDRKLLAGALLSRFDEGELEARFLTLVGLFGRLFHPGLAQQLREFWAVEKHSAFARCAAIEIAEACNLHDLAPELAQLAASHQQFIRIRIAAAQAVHHLKNEAAKESLLQVLRSDLRADTKDELKGTALLATWPQYLSFPELLEHLSPRKASNLIGAYAMFLYGLEVPELSPSLALQALEWSATRQSEIEEQNLTDLADTKAAAKVFWAAAQRIDSPEVRIALANIIAFSVPKFRSWPFRTAGEDGNWPEKLDWRQGLVREVLSRSIERPLAARVLRQLAPGLIRPDDVAGYLEAIKSESDKARRIEFAELLLDLTFEISGEDLWKVFDASEAIPELAEALNSAYYIELDSQPAQWKREAWLRTRESERRKTALLQASEDADKAVLDALDQMEAGDLDKWWRLNVGLFVSTSGKFESEFEFRSDLTATPGWQRLSARDRQRVVDAAGNYLENATLRDWRFFGTSTHHRPAAAAFRALRLLADLNPSRLDRLPEDAWRSWGPAALSFFDNAPATSKDVQQMIVRRAWEARPEAIQTALARIALGRRSAGLTQRVLDLIGGLFDSRIGEYLDRLRRRPSFREADGSGTTFNFLIRSGYEPAIEETLAAMTDATTAKAPRHGPILGAAQLLIQQPQRLLPMVMTLGRDQPEVAMAIWEDFCGSPAVRNGGGKMLSTPENELATVYLELTRLFPDPPEEEERARFLTSIDRVQQFRASILRRLTSAGTADSVSALERIEAHSPAAPWLRIHVQEGRWNARSAARQLIPAESVIGWIGRLGIRLPPRDELAAMRASIQANYQGSESKVPTEVQTSILSEQIPRRHLKIAAITTEWNSGHGGLSTLNRELCIALAALGHTVLCAVESLQEDARVTAAAVGVKLLGAPFAPGIDGMQRLLLLKPDHFGPVAPDVVIGHDQVTGSYALHIARSMGSAYVHILHTVPEESEAHKARPGEAVPKLLKGSEKADAQLEIARASDLVVGVGPKIHDNIATRLGRDIPTHMLIPGLNTDLLLHVPEVDLLKRTRCLLSGRMEDAILKGVALGCNAIRALDGLHPWGPGKRPQLMLRGFQSAESEAQKEFSIIGDYEEYRSYVIPRSYSDLVSKVHGDLKECSLVIMPSRSEGFGLSAYEAIAAGIPILVSMESGLAEFLVREGEIGTIDRVTAELSIAQVIGSESDVLKLWSDRMLRCLLDRHAAFDRARKLRDALVSRFTWSETAKEFTSAIIRSLPKADVS